VPTPDETRNARPWLEREIELLKPELSVPVARVASEQFLSARARAWVEQIGTMHAVTLGRVRRDEIRLPHPSGVATWPRAEPGQNLTARALALTGAHPAWRALRGS